MRKVRLFLAGVGLVSVPVMALLIGFDVFDLPWYATFAPLLGVFVLNASIASLEDIP